MTLTKRDFDEMKTIFPTKVEMLNRFDRLERKSDKRYHNVMNTLNKILKMFLKFDEERVVLTHKVSDYGDRIEKLENRFVIS